MPPRAGQSELNPPFDSYPELSRRQVLKQAVINTASLVALDKLGVVYIPNPFDGGDLSIEEPGSPKEFNERYTTDFSDSNPFEHEAAQAVAAGLKITSGDYYKLSPEVRDEVSKSGLFRTENKLAPVFFPEVTDKQKYLENAADHFGIPVNVFASLACIESAGIVSAESSADAYGVVQVVPAYHFDKFAAYLPDYASLDDYYDAKAGRGSDVSLEDYRKVFTNPEYNTLAGAEYFAECIASARKRYEDSDFDENNLVIYATAAAMYNGGQGGAGHGYDHMQVESQLYVNHVARILLDVETSLRLRQDGYSDGDILKAMKSKHMDAMAYSYDQQPRNPNTIDDYKIQAAIIDGIKDMKQAPSEMSVPFFDYYDGRVTQYSTPMAPGLRIWFAGGGAGLFTSSDKNRAWKA